MTDDGRTLLPCSRRLYQAGLTLARKATSSRRSPGERRRWFTGRPDGFGFDTFTARSQILAELNVP